MNLLLKHHFIAGWRNILKYKVQNIISVLCLAVGTVVFAVVLWFANCGWNEFRVKQLTGDRIEIHLNTAHALSEADEHQDEKNVAQLQTLQSVKSVYFESVNEKVLYASCKIFDGAPAKQSFSYKIVSQEWLELNHVKSVTTGKKLRNLKNGTVLISERAYNQRYKKYISNAVGSKILNTTRPMQIDDMVSYDSRFSDATDLLVITDCKEELIKDEDDNYSFSITPIQVTLKDGYDVNAFQREAKQKMPETNVDIVPAMQQKTIAAIYCALLFAIFLGACVLIIGLSGYLKMQIQLFYLRNREMALRRCNGAKPLQLFMLLATEMFITFVFVLLVTIGLSYILNGYATPKMQSMMPFFYVPMNIIFAIEAKIALVTFALSTLICWISSRKVMRMPLSQAAGKSFVPKTRWRNALQVAQYFVATIFLLLIMFLFICVYDSNSRYHTPYQGDISKYKEVVSLFTLDNDSLETLPTVKHVARILNAENAIAIDPASMKIMDLKVKAGKQAAMNHDSVYSIPVYVKTSEAKQICKQFGIAYRPFSIDDMEGNYPLNGLIAIGYAPKLDIYNKFYNVSNMYVVRPHITQSVLAEMRYQAEQDSLSSFWPEIMVFSQEGKYEEMLDEIGNKFIDNYKNIRHGYFKSAYDKYFSQYYAYSLTLQFALVMLIISIISIVLTVYSSVALETRGKQKEVAIRKVNGAKTRDIILLFSRPYIKTLTITYGLAVISDVVMSLIVRSANNDDFSFEDFGYMSLFYFVSILFITLVTFLTIWQKIYKTAKVNPAEIIQNS